MMSWLRASDAHVVGIVEAVRWENAPPAGWIPDPLRGRQRRRGLSVLWSEDEEDGEGEGWEEEAHLWGPTRRALVGGGGKNASSFVSPPSKPSPAPAPAPAPATGSGSGSTAAPPPTLPQTAAFKRRMASAGYPYSHLLRTPSGFHMALLSTLPLTIVHADTLGENFQRGLLVGDAGGTRWVLTHLHAGDAGERAREAARVWSLLSSYTRASIPSVLMGDFNSLSPLDAACHVGEGVLGGLTDPKAPPHLLTKYTCPASSPGCREQAALVERAAAAAAASRGGVGAASSTSSSGSGSGTTLPPPTSGPSTPKKGGVLLDYRPIQLLLSPLRGGGGGEKMEDLLILPHASSSSSSTLPTTTTTSTPPLPPPTTCPASYPTVYIAGRAGIDTDDHDDNGHVPLRLDFALGNPHFLASHPGVRCKVGGLDFTAEGYAIEPSTGRRLSQEDATEAFKDFAKASDHLPLVCRHF